MFLEEVSQSYQFVLTVIDALGITGYKWGYTKRSDAAEHARWESLTSTDYICDLESGRPK